MKLVSWRPARNAFALQDDIKTLFANSSDNVPITDSDFRGMWNPRVDISETEDNVLIKAEIPGIDKDNIKLSIHDGVMSLMGEKKQEKRSEGENVYWTERAYGLFQRSFAIPDDIQQDKIRANYKDGVLTVLLPKAEALKPKEISIEVK